MLQLARNDAGRVLTLEPIPIAPVLNDVVRAARGMGRTVEVEDIPLVTVEADRDALLQVLLNLVENADKFTQDGGRVEMAVGVTERTVTIHVRDTGAGISDAELPRIFDRFYRGETSGANGGSGLGLAIAKTLIEAQGGHIIVESQVDIGSTFSIVMRRATSIIIVATKPVSVES
jgi:signal transduction histidine kinase